MSLLVGTSYNSAKSRSSNTFWPRIKRIAFSIRSAGIRVTSAVLYALPVGGLSRTSSLRSQIVILKQAPTSRNSLENPEMFLKIHHPISKVAICDLETVPASAPFPYPSGHSNRRTSAAEAWPWGVTLKLMKFAPGGTSPLRTAETGQVGSGVL